MRGILIGGMILSLLLGCNNGAIEELEKKSSFYESVIKIGHEFQGIFGIFGNAIGEALGFNAVKSGDLKSKVGEHFDKIKEGLKKTKDKLDGLEKEITSIPHSDAKGVEDVIKNASGVFTKLIESVSKIAGVTKDSNPIGDNASNGASVAAKKDDVDVVIKEVKNIVDVAEKSDVRIPKGDAGSSPITASAQTSATAVLNSSSQATAQSGPALAGEISKADPWAMIDKIKNAKTKNGALTKGDSNDAGVLATGTSSEAHGVNAATNADLASAVALKAMITNGKFSAASTEVEGVKASGVRAVNKLLGVLDEIIRRIVSSELYKVGKAVNGMQYSENTSEKSEGATK